MPKYAEEILAAVTELQQHPTAEQVFLEMKREHPRIALGTVYKHLNGLAEEGLLLRITEPGSPDRYDRTERHDHLICSRCGENHGRSAAGYTRADPGGTGAGDPLLRPQDPVYLPRLPGAGKRQHYGGEAP